MNIQHTQCSRTGDGSAITRGSKRMYWGGCSFLVISFAFLFPASPATADEAKTQAVIPSTDSKLEEVPAFVGCRKTKWLSGKPITNQHTPEELIDRVNDCVRAGDYALAAKLHLLTGAYSRFDQLRVKDKTAHQAALVLTVKNFQTWPQDQKVRFDAVYQDTLKNKLGEVCGIAAKLGAPEYFPTYMVRHGMGAINNAINATPLDVSRSFPISTRERRGKKC
jgi:hypothetical protein